MRDDLAYPHIGIAIHFIMIKRVHPPRAKLQQRYTRLKPWRGCWTGVTHWNKTCTANTHTARAVRRDLGSAPRRVCASCPTTNHVDPDAPPGRGSCSARR